MSAARTPSELLELAVKYGSVERSKDLVESGADATLDNPDAQQQYEKLRPVTEAIWKERRDQRHARLSPKREPEKPQEPIEWDGHKLVLTGADGGPKGKLTVQQQLLLCETYKTRNRTGEAVQINLDNLWNDLRALDLIEVTDLDERSFLFEDLYGNRFPPLASSQLIRETIRNQARAANIFNVSLTNRGVSVAIEAISAGIMD